MDASRSARGTKEKLKCQKKGVSHSYLETATRGGLSKMTECKKAKKAQSSSEICQKSPKTTVKTGAAQQATPAFGGKNRSTDSISSGSTKQASRREAVPGLQGWLGMSFAAGHRNQPGGRCLRKKKESQKAKTQWRWFANEKGYMAKKKGPGGVRDFVLGTRKIQKGGGCTARIRQTGVKNNYRQGRQTRVEQHRALKKIMIREKKERFTPGLRQKNDRVEAGVDADGETPHME